MITPATLLLNITLVTHLSSERIYPLYELRRRWEGPIAVAFYVRSAEDVEELSIAMATLRDVDFAVEIPSLGRHGDITSYPANVMRNLAMSLVKTTHALVVDGDFVPSVGLYGNLTTTWAHLLVDNPTTAFILPCFRAARKDAVPKTFEEVCKHQ